jgi:hypothetical protein
MILQCSEKPNLLVATAIYIGLMAACYYYKQPTAALAIMVVGVYDVKCYLEGGGSGKVMPIAPVLVQSLNKKTPLVEETCNSGTCSAQVEQKDPNSASNLGDNFDIIEYSELNDTNMPATHSSICKS